MKILIVFLGIFCNTCLLFGQYTAVPDTNFEAYLEANGMGDGIPDNGLVLTANIENVTELIIQGQMNITDLTGIEDFTALEVFYCAFNPVVSVNLSQNINLTHVGFASSMLSTLDLSNNNNLVYAGGMYNLELNTLIVTSPFITEIEFWENHLTQIDITNCPALEVLDVHYNVYLSSLDVTNNPNLKVLRCGENNLSALNISNNPLLEVLAIGNNPNLTSLNLSHNPLLQIFTAGHNNSMTNIDVRNGNNEIITTFSANPSTNLQCVYVDDASAPYLEGWNVPNHTQFANNEQDCQLMSVEDNQRPLFSIYPNPVTDSVIILLNSSAAFTLMNAEGKVIKKGNFTPGKNTVSFAGFTEGMYFLYVSTENGKFVKKVIKK